VVDGQRKSMCTGGRGGGDDIKVFDTDGVL
jgi:hypothetical protein